MSSAQDPSVHNEREPLAPRVSVIVNVRNGAVTLRETLNSLLAQTFRDWEAIVWDDFSTDTSADVVLAYDDSRIRFFRSPEDTSLGRARHLAMQYARGEWLAFLDQDDIWLPRKLEQQIALANRPEVAFIYGRTLAFFPDGSERDFDHRHEFEPLPQGHIFDTLFTESCYVCMSSVMLRRSAVEELGGIPEIIAVSPDYFLYLGVTHKYEARAVQAPVCRYRLHDENMSRFCGRKMHEEVLWMLDQWASHLSPRVLAKRRRVHHTLVALQDMMHFETLRAGVVRLLRHGSPAFLLSRPFARTFRAARRRIRRPYYFSKLGESF